jgi:hypothetical protein
MKEIKENIIRLVGSASIPEELKVDQGYKITLEVDVCSKEEKSNQDGSVTQVFKAKPTGEFEINKELGERIVARTKGESWSKKWRNIVFAKNEIYEEIMPILCKRADDVIEFIKK